MEIVLYISTKEILLYTSQVVLRELDHHQFIHAID